MQMITRHRYPVPTRNAGRVSRPCRFRLEVIHSVAHRHLPRWLRLDHDPLLTARLQFVQLERTVRRHGGLHHVVHVRPRHKGHGLGTLPGILQAAQVMERDRLVRLHHQLYETASALEKIGPEMPRFSPTPLPPPPRRAHSS